MLVYFSLRCTFVYGTPTMYVDMVNQPDLAKRDLSSLEAGEGKTSSVFIDSLFIENSDVLMSCFYAFCDHFSDLMFFFTLIFCLI